MKERIERCIAKISLENLDGLLISSSINITYLTGFREAEGYLLVSRNAQPVYFTNFLYKYEAKKLNNCEVRISTGDIFKLIAETTQKLALKKIGFEAKNLPFLEYRKIKDFLSKYNIDFLKTIDIIESLRKIKTPQEIACIRKSIAITLQALQFTQEIASEKFTEKGLSIEIEKFLRLKGDNQIAFPIIVASGKNSAFAHHICSQAKLNHKFFLIDLGAKYYGYCADLTRVFFWGKMPFLFRKIYDIVLKAKDLGIKSIKDGVAAKKVDLAAREYIEKSGFAKYFGHGLGHGVGLAVHEAPFINSKNEEILKEGMVITVEPAIYLNGKFGVRLEDMVLVKSNKGEILSRD
jgi:Xaa-Pro aminopeptidase